MLSQYLDVGLATRILETGDGGVGYVLKDTLIGSSDLVGVLRRIAEGGSVIDPSLVRALLRRRAGNDPIDQLSGREREVLEQMAEGRSNAGIADALTVTEKTVEFHVSSIFSKLGLEASSADHRRVLAVLVFLAARSAAPPGSPRQAGRDV